MTQHRELNVLDGLVLEHFSEGKLQDFAPTFEQRQEIIKHVMKEHCGLYSEENKHVIAFVEGEFNPERHAV